MNKEMEEMQSRLVEAIFTQAALLQIQMLKMELNNLVDQAEKKQQQIDKLIKLTENNI